jgi:hypothetical protein
MSSPLADDLQQIADEAGRTRRRLEDLSRACAELRTQLARHEVSKESTGETPERLQSVS